LQRLVCYMINSLCCFLYHREYKKFAGIQDIKKEQAEKLFHILNKNSTCEYGRKYDFKSINKVAEYQRTVPLTTFEDYSESIEKIKNGEKNILTKEDVLLLELTSGSVSASKLIPYTRALKEEFQKGLKPWIYSLYSGHKGIRWGKSYWSVTPATMQKQYTKGGIPIGFEEDSEYFGRLEKKLFDTLFAVPSHVTKEKNMEDFYYKTALHLLKCKNLTLISVWNPTFLLLLLAYMEKNCDRLVSELSDKNKRRGQEVGEALDKKAYDKLWKHLKVISCWCDANAESYADKLKAWFPQVTVQPKGLLATEGFVSFPLTGEKGARLSVRSHFFEFQSLPEGEIVLAHELQQGKEYAVILTTSGGLYRYKLNDIIEVTGFSGVFPLIKFRGKQDKVSDLFGEKLNELFVKNTMEKLDVKPEFYMLAPDRDRYVLYIKSGKIPVNIEEALRENFHYDYCRKLGQLKELRIFKLTGDPEQEYMKECVRRGQRLGDIKPVALHLQGGWDSIFKGEYL
jgi:hypothetical protein